jgi:hypothetical protein
MKDLRLACFLALAVLLNAAAAAGQQNPASGGTPVSMVVTAEARHGMNPPPVTEQDVMVYEGKLRDPVTSWVPAKDDHAQLEFFILLDDSTNVVVATQFDDLRQFINSQPETTKIGIAYMQNGVAQIAQNPTVDHAQAAKALRLPLGVAGVNASPYFSLQDLISKWPQTSLRREILMISDGIDLYYGMPDLQDPYVGDAIGEAQRAGVVVDAIYNPGAGHYAHDYWRSYWGQLYLSQVSDETGGESYYIGFTGPAVAFSPYLEDVERRLNNQYLLTFLAKPEKKSGFERVRINTELSNTQLIAADRVYVPASAQ